MTDSIIHQVLRLDEEGQRSIKRRGRLGHYLTGMYRTIARPIATRQLILRARLKDYIWGFDDAALLIERAPNRYLIPLLEAFGATIGAGSYMGETLRIAGGNRAHLLHPEARAPLKGLVVGRESFWGRRIMLDLSAPITFGDFSAIGNDTRFFTHTDLYASPLVPEVVPLTFGPIRIGRGVFVGPGSTVANGVTIGECSIIGANSVILRDIPPYCMAAGAPAKVIKELDRSKIRPMNDAEAFIIPEGTTG
jgi:acetyltransferase-like isoleucine patch superfamily enzyme